MLAEIAKYGTPTFKRIYADWTKPTVSGWKTVLLENGITPVQQYSYTTGKNATDSAMIIDAMDILYTGRVDGFCIVSSDSDFTRLATRLREAGMKVYGIGEKKTPVPFIAACDKFIYLEILGVNLADEYSSAHDSAELSASRSYSQEDKSFKTAAQSSSRPIGPVDKATISLITSSIADLADDNGWAFLGAVGNLVLKKKPSFDSRNFGFAKLSQMIRSIEGIESEERINEKNPLVTLIYIRNSEDD